MKKKIIYMLAIAGFTLLMSGCTKVCTITGTITDELATTPGAAIVFTDMLTEQKDTVQIVDGKFEYSCNADVNGCFTVALVTEAKIRNKNNITFIPEPGTITIDLNEPATVEGGKHNKALFQFRDLMKLKYEVLMAEFEVARELPQEEAAAKTKELQDNYRTEVRELCEKTIEASPNGYLGFYALYSLINLGGDVSYAELKGYVEKMGDFTKNNPLIKRQLAAGEAEENTAEGKMFVDFEGKTPAGEPVKLSDYVGKGQYVLVDFWASWCGPCKREIENTLLSVYDTYTPKGLVVLGVAVWERNGDNSASVATMEELGMKWDQIFMGDDKTPTDLYGISGIPQIILFAPDGTIVKRNLRGEELIAAVEEALTPAEEVTE